MGEWIWKVVVCLTVRGGADAVSVGREMELYMGLEFGVEDAAHMAFSVEDRTELRAERRLA